MSPLPLSNAVVILCLLLNIVIMSLILNGDRRTMARAHAYVWFAIIVFVYLVIDAAYGVATFVSGR